MKKFWNSIKDYVYIVLIVLLIRTFILTPAIVSGTSMDDTLNDGQLVLINKFIYRFNDIERFDIVVLENDKTDEKIIKRVIGLPNERIDIIDNKLYINNELVNVDFKYKETDNFSYITEEDEYFVLGDNRPVSKDSRFYGAFKSEDIIGRVKYRFFPFSKFGKIED